MKAAVLIIRDMVPVRYIAGYAAVYDDGTAEFKSVCGDVRAATCDEGKVWIWGDAGVSTAPRDASILS